MVKYFFLIDWFFIVILIAMVGIFYFNYSYFAADDFLYFGWRCKAVIFTLYNKF